MTKYLEIVFKSKSNKIYIFSIHGYMEVGNPPILITEKFSLGISVTIIELWNIKEWFAYPSLGTLKQKKENFNIVIGDKDIGISKKCQPNFLWFFKLQYLLN